MSVQEGPGDPPAFSGVSRPGSNRWIWWRLFGLLLAVCSAWALALPLMTGPDEPPQAIRAAAVVRGQMVGEDPEWDNARVSVRVPEAYASADRVGYCFLGPAYEMWHPLMLSTTPRRECPSLPNGTDEALVPTTQHRGQPAYYLAVGWPSLLLPGATGAHLMRFAAGAICSALLASAFVSALRLARPRLAVTAMWLTVTPVVVYLAATVNSAGLEVAAALAAWVTGLALVNGPDGPDRRLVTRAGVALSVLAVARGMSPAFVVVILMVLGLLASPARRRQLLARGDVRVALGLLAGALAASGAWLLYVQRVFPLPDRPGAGVTEAVGELAWWLRGTIAMFGSTDVVPPAALPGAWLTAGALVLGLAWWAGARRHVAVAVGLAVLATGLLVIGHGLDVPPIGYWWQGRYVLPILVGALPVAAAGAVRRTGQLGPTLIAVAGVLHLWAFLYATRHYTVGYDGPANPVRFLWSPEWVPPGGSPLLWVGLLAVSLAGLAAVTWQAAVAAERCREEGPNRGEDGPSQPEGKTVLVTT